MHNAGDHMRTNAAPQVPPPEVLCIAGRLRRTLARLEATIIAREPTSDDRRLLQAQADVIAMTLREFRAALGEEATRSARRWTRARRPRRRVHTPAEAKV